MIRAVVIVLALAGAVAHADPTPEEAVSVAAKGFLTALGAGADEVLEVSFAPTVKLSKLAFATDACTKAFGKKKSIKRGRAKLARCLFPDDARPDASTLVTVEAAGKAWSVTVGGVVFRFTKRAGAYVIDRVTGVPVTLTKFEAEGDFVSHGTIKHGVRDGGPAPVSTLIEPVVAIGTIGGDLGDLDLAQVTRVFKVRQGILRACYQKELNRQRGLAGTIVLEVEVNEAGQTRSATIVSIDATLANDGLESCLVSNVMRLRYPETSKPATLRVPLGFSQSRP